MSKKLLKQREKRFSQEVVVEPPKKVFSHSEGIVYLSADPKVKLLDLCKRKLAAGETLTDLQYDALLRYGVDPGTIGATRRIVGVDYSSSSASSASSAQAHPASHKRAREDAPAGSSNSGTPKVVLRKDSIASVSSTTPKVIYTSAMSAACTALLAALPSEPAQRVKACRKQLHKIADLNGKKASGQALSSEEESLVGAKSAISGALREAMGKLTATDEG